MNSEETSQELRMMSRSLSNCKSLLLNVMIQVSQFIRKSLQTRFIHHGVLLLLFLIPIQHGFGPQVGVTPQTVGTVELCIRLFQSAWSSSHNSPRALSPGRCIERKELQVMVLRYESSTLILCKELSEWVSESVSQSVSEWLSEWQGHLLSCSGQLKRK